MTGANLFSASWRNAHSISSLFINNSKAGFLFSSHPDPSADGEGSWRVSIFD